MDNNLNKFWSKNTTNYCMQFDGSIENRLPRIPKKTSTPQLTEAQIKALNTSLAMVKAVSNLKVESSKPIYTQVTWSQIKLHKTELKRENPFINPDTKPKQLSNGNILSSNELGVIHAYTYAHYRLINGSLDGDQTNLHLYKQEHQFSTNEMKKYLAGAHYLAKALASALNKLPPTKLILYRGDAIPLKALDEWKMGKTFVSQKFMSCSPDIGESEQFALDNAAEYEEDTFIEHRPVLFVFDAKRAKDISPFSIHKKEREHLYLPGQGFRTIKVDDKAYPGLIVIYLREVERTNSTWKG